MDSGAAGESVLDCAGCWDTSEEHANSTVKSALIRPVFSTFTRSSPPPDCASKSGASTLTICPTLAAVTKRIEAASIMSVTRDACIRSTV